MRHSSLLESPGGYAEFHSRHVHVACYTHAQIPEQSVPKVFSQFLFPEVRGLSMKYTSRSSLDGSSAVTGHFTLACMGAIALLAGVGCTNPQIQGGTDNSGGSGQKGGGSGSNGGAGGGVSFTVPKIPDAAPTLPGGGFCGQHQFIGAPAPERLGSSSNRRSGPR